MRLLVVLFGASLLLVSSTEKEPAKLPKELKEISGWIFANDTTLIAHNDGGDSAKLYVLNLDGSIRNSVLIKNVRNIDFEDIAKDQSGNVYVGDFGNNNNKRTDLVIYKVNLKKILSSETVDAESILFSYPNQKEFPPKLNGKYFDCEAMSFYNDSLYLFTKCRTEPFDGRCYVYTLPTKAGTYVAAQKYYMVLGTRDWFRDAATAAEIYKNKLYLLTYNRFIVHTFEGGKAKYESHQTLLPITQKEALTVSPKGKIYIADERHKLIGGGNMYIYSQNKKNKK